MKISTLLGVSWGLSGSLGPPWGCLGALLELSWGALGSSWGSRWHPSASIGGLLDLKGAQEDFGAHCWPISVCISEIVC